MRDFWDPEIMLEVSNVYLQQQGHITGQINWASRPLRFAVVFQSIGHLPGLGVVLCQAVGFSSWSYIDEKIILGFCGAIGHQ